MRILTGDRGHHLHTVDSKWSQWATKVETVSGHAYQKRQIRPQGPRASFGLPVGQLAFVNDIAVANNIPKKFLDAILGELRNAGFVLSRKGKEGGYRLARPASEIKIGHVVRVLDGPLAPIPCASRTQYQRCEDCDEATCQVRHMMLEVRQAIAEVLDNSSLAAMRDADNDDDMAAELRHQV